MPERALSGTGAATTRLVVVQGPLQAIVAAATVRHLEQSGGARHRNVLVIGGLYSTRRNELEEATRNCAGAVDWDLVLTAEADDHLPPLPLEQADVAEVLCARNWQSLNREALDAFPAALRLSYGDGIGVLDTDRSPGVPQFARALLILPQPELAGVLEGQELELVPLDRLREAIAAARAAAAGLAEADHRLARFAAGGVLALLGNLTEAGATTLTSERRQARVLIGRAATPGAPVVLKPHPRASLGQAAAVARDLRAAGHPVRIMVPAAQGTYPIELFSDLVHAVARIQPGLSSSAVSLVHLHGMTTGVDLPVRLARTTLFPDSWNRALGTLAHHRRTLRELNSWDGRSPLPEPPDLAPSRVQIALSLIPRRLLAWHPRPGLGGPPSPPKDQTEFERRAATTPAGGDGVRQAVRPSTHRPAWRAALARFRSPAPSPPGAPSAEELEDLIEAHADLVFRRDRAGTTELRWTPRTGA